jgi:hypothetical protein
MISRQRCAASYFGRVMAHATGARSEASIKKAFKRRDLLVHSHRMAGSFYPKGLRPADYLNFYALHFDTVVIDSTFHTTPNVSGVRFWKAKSPEGFLGAFIAKFR